MEFLAGYFSVLGGRVKAGMAQVFLKEPEPIARIIKFYSVDSKGIAKSVR